MPLKFIDEAKSAASTCERDRQSVTFRNRRAGKVALRRQVAARILDPHLTQAECLTTLKFSIVLLKTSPFAFSKTTKDQGGDNKRADGV
jgi:hypothetical protein